MVTKRIKGPNMHDLRGFKPTWFTLAGAGAWWYGDRFFEWFVF